MKKLLTNNWLLLFLIGFFLFVSPVPSIAGEAKESVSESDPLHYSSTELLIQLKNNCEFDSFALANPLKTKYPELNSLNSIFQVKKIFPLITRGAVSSKQKILTQTYLFHFAKLLDISKLKKLYQSLNIVKLVEPNYFYFANNSKSFPSLFSDKIQLNKAASYINPQKPVIVGIIDSGVDWNRTDLTGNIWQNFMEKPDGKDNDNNGFIDDTWGCNFSGYDTTAFAGKNQLSDLTGHGTSILKTINQVINYHNSELQDSVSNKLMVLKADRETKNGNIVFTAFSVSRAIIYAANHGANIINLSWGGDYPSKILKQAIDYALDRDCIVIASAGDNNSSSPFYPAAFENVIAVAATNQDDRKSDFSNFGNWIDISAPGSFPSNQSPSDSIKKEISGTDIAAAYVSGLAGLLLSNEEQVDNDSLKKRIIFSSENIYQNNQEFAGKLGAGRINFYRALNAQQKPNIVIQKITFQNTRQNKKLIPDELVSIFVELKNLSFSAKNISIQLFSNNKNVHLINSEDFIPNLNFQAEYKNIHNPLKILIDKNIIPTPKTEIILQIKANNDFSLVKNYPIPMGVDQPKNLRTTIDSVNLKQVPEFLFFPENDNLIALGDSILLRIESQNLSNKKIKVQWKINNVIVNNDSSYFLLKDSSPLLTGQDTIQVSVFGEQIDSSIVHSWFITKEEPVKKLIEYSFFPRADTSISAGDSIQFSFNLKNYAGDSLNYQWFLNDSVMSVAYDSLFIYSPLSDSIKKDTIRVVVSNEDTVLIHEWIIKYILKTPTSEDIFYYPISDTSIFEGDTLKLGIKFFYGEDSLINFHWSVNNFGDSTDTNSSYLMTTDFSSSGIDTVSLTFNKGDSLYKHQWIINIQNKNRPPQILSRTTVLDTTLTLDDQMYYSVEVFDPDSDSFTYSWALNSIVDSSATDSFYIYFSENNFSESDTLQLKISDADTSLTIDWIIRHSININHPPQIISATPRLDLILTKSDSVEFKISCFDEDGDSLQFKWLRNNIIDTTAIDSFYFYYLNDPEQSSDSITVLVFDGDTSTFAQWILFPDSTFDNPPISRNPIIFYPEMDTLFAEKDSLNFIISNLPDSIDVQWSINNRNDSTATDSSFIYYLPDKGNTIDTIQVRLTSQDTLFSHEWYIYYPELSVQKDSLRLAFFPEKETINFSTNDSLKFFVQLKAGNLSDINIHWFVNHELDEVNSDTCFFFMPDTSITRIDTITVLITHSDTTIVNNWAIQYEPVLKLPAPVLLYPIEGNQISEFETLSWENDSSLAAIDSTTKWKYVVQLSNDSTFSEIFSTDTCSVSSLTFNELEGFKKIFIKAPIYWRVKLFLEQNKISEFINSPLPFYYFPMFVTLEIFYGEKNEEGILLFWTTSYEANCAGFNILRSETPDGDFQKINDYLITGQKSYSWIDKSNQAGVTFYYKLEEITINGRQKFHQTISIDLPAPAKYSLSQNFPNPFNSTTAFKYQIPKTTHVLIEVFNILGKKVKALVDERKDAGYYTVYWDGADDSGENVVSGIYFYIISADKFHATNKMIVVR